MKYVYIANILNLSIGSTLSKGKKIEDFRVSNSNENLLSLFDQGEFIEMFGRLDLNSLLGTTYLYGKGSFKGRRESNDSIDFIKELNILNGKAQFFTSLLWLIKDNSVHLETGFLISDTGVGMEFTKNAIYHSFLNALGTYEPVTFSKEEIDQVNVYWQLFDGETTNTGERIEPINPLGKKYKRIERALYLLGYARSESNLALRIMLYCTVLESLFTTDNREVSHKVAERFALILGSNTEEKLQHFKLVKNAYSIRSKAVHGQTVNNDPKELGELSQNIDSALRRLFRGILDGEETFGVFHTKNDDFERFFTELIMQ